MTLFDVAPEPVAIGVALAVILLVIAIVILLAAGLVFFLWYRKRNLRHREMVRPPND
jgi:flagellar basal body-associated protein FliL